MAVALPIAAIAGTAFSAFGAFEGMQAQSQAAAYQAQVAQNNAIIAQQNATHALEAGQSNSEQKSLQGAAEIGAIKAAQAGAGVDVNSGSALDVQSSQRDLNKLATLNTENQAQLAAYGYRAQATSYQAQSGLDTLESQDAADSSYFKLAGGLLGGASSLGGAFGSTSGGAPSDGSPWITPGGYFGGAT